MIKLTAVYGKPQDPTAFDDYYFKTHTPLAQKLPGLKGLVVNKPVSLNPQEPSPYYLIADLYFDTMEAFQNSLQSPEGQATAGDIQNFATGGVNLVVGEVRVVDPVSIS